MAAQPFDDRDGWVWMDGEFVPHREAKVHVLTHAIHYASAVFEGERAYGGVVFKGHDHSLRLHKSAKILGFQVPASVEDIDQAKNELIKKLGFENCYLRAIAWRGSEQMGVAAKRDDVHVAISAWEWGDYFADKMKGVRLMIAPWRRPAPDTSPWNSKAAGLYMICTLSRHAANDAGFDDAIMMDWRGQIAEGTGANIFFVRDGVLHTPTPDCFLNGITRQTVIKLARERGIEVIERAIWPNELATFSVPEVLAASEGRSYVDYAFHLAPMQASHIDEIPSLVDDHGVTSFKIFMFYGSHGLHGASSDQSAFLMIPPDERYDVAHFEFVMRGIQRVREQRPDIADRISLSLGSLDDPTRVVPAKQFGIESRVTFLATLTGLPGTRTEDDVPPADMVRLISRQHPDQID